jgi:hypothetical protein
MEINVRSAVVAAKKYFEDIQDMIGDSINDILLEEVELSENKKFWHVTFLFSRPVAKTERSLIPDAISLTTKYERTYAAERFADIVPLQYPKQSHVSLGLLPGYWGNEFSRTTGCNQCLKFASEISTRYSSK